MNRFESVTKPLTWFMAFLLAAFVAGCGGGSSGGTLSSAKAITAYSLTWSTGTSGIATGTINEPAKTIVVPVPSLTDVRTMVATFTTTGSSVTLGGVAQTSGTWAHNFTNPLTYTVTAADGSTVAYTVTVNVGAGGTAANPTAPTLGEAGRYVILASQSVTTTGVTAIHNGDIGNMDQVRASYITGFTPDTLDPGIFAELTNGYSYAADDLCPHTSASTFACPLHYATPVVGATWTDAATMITQVRNDLGVAYLFLATDPNPGVATTVLADTQLGGKIFTRGVYQTGAPLLITTPLQLDAQGDPNSIWIFTTASNLTTGATGNISFVSGIGSAKNVYWRVGGITTIASGTTFLGNVFGYANVNVNSGAVITGSLYSTTAAVTLIANAVTKAP